MAHNNFPDPTVTVQTIEADEQHDNFDNQIIEAILEFALQNNHLAVAHLKHNFSFSAPQVLAIINWVSQNTHINQQTIESLVTEDFNPNSIVGDRRLLASAVFNNNLALTKFLLSKGSEPLFARSENISFLELVNNSQWLDSDKIDVLQISLGVISNKIRGARTDNHGDARCELVNNIVHNFIAKISANEVDEIKRNKLINSLVESRDVMSSDYLSIMNSSEIFFNAVHRNAIWEEINIRATEAVNSVLEGDYAFINLIREREDFYNSDEFLYHAFTQIYNKDVSRESLEIIFDEGFSPNRYLNEENSFLTYAARAGNYNLVNFLLDRGSDPNFCAESKKRPLSLALQMPESSSKSEIISRLLSVDGIKVNFVNEENRTPFSIACELARSNPEQYGQIVNHIAALSVDLLRQGRVVSSIWGKIEEEWVENSDLLSTDILEEMQRFSLLQQESLGQIIEQRLQLLNPPIAVPNPDQNAANIDVMEPEEIVLQVEGEIANELNSPALFPSVGEASNLVESSQEHQKKKARFS